MIKFLGIIILFASFSVAADGAKKCLLVMSYHQGYEWNDGIEKGVNERLASVCQLKTIYLDTKRNASVAFGKAAGLKAKALIDEFRPDVLISADDNASRYVVEPYYKNTSLPIIFCGINWTASEYGYPYQNATGMVEVAPIIPLLKNIQRSIGSVTHGVYLSSDVVTEHKDFLRFKNEYTSRGIKLKSEFVSSMNGWKLAFLNSQDSDFVILGNNAGINNWDHKEIAQFVRKNNKALTVTNNRWMMPYTMFGMTKSATEQGQWAGDVALAVLEGLPINSIPITINKSWYLFANTDLLNAASINLSNKILNHAYKSW